MRIIGLVILLSLFLFSLAVAQPAAYDKKCTATVDGQTAQFIFPLPKGQIWSWDMKETSDLAEE